MVSGNALHDVGAQIIPFDDARDLRIIQIFLVSSEAMRDSD